MNINQLQYFVGAVDAGSMNQAATNLFISRQSLSAAIKSLEQELGVKLLDRNSAGVCLTEEGKTVYKMAINMIGEFRRAELQLSKPAPVDDVNLRALVSLGADTVFLSSIVSRFKLVRPHVIITVQSAQSADCLEWLGQGLADMALVGFPAGYPMDYPDHVVKLACYAEREIAILPKSHALASRKTISLDQALESPLILLRHPSGQKRASAVGEPWSSNPKARIALITDNPKTQLDSVAAGVGIGFVPETSLRYQGSKELLERLQLVAVKIVPEMLLTLCCCVNEKTYKQKREIVDEFLGVCTNLLDLKPAGER